MDLSQELEGEQGDWRRQEGKQERKEKIGTRHLGGWVGSTTLDLGALIRWGGPRIHVRDIHTPIHVNDMYQKRVKIK